MALRIILIFAFIVGIVVYKETRPKKVKTVIVKKTKVTPAPVQQSVETAAEPTVVEEKKDPETQPTVSETQAVKVETPVEIKAEPAVTEVVPEPEPAPAATNAAAFIPTKPAEIPPPQKVTFTSYPRNENLSPEDRIVDLKETVPNIRNELQEIYKNKTFSSKYGPDKITDLTVDAIQYISDPEGFQKKSSEEVLRNTKEFLLNVEKIRKQYEVRR